MGPFSQPQWPSWAYSGLGDPFSPYSQLSNYPTYLADSMEAYQTHHNRHLVHQMSRATESKPRLSKEEVELLEAEFQKNHKPSSSTKKALAESMRVDNARINNWFQNRRAREKKENNIREYEAKQRLEKEKAEVGSGGQSDDSRKSDCVASSAPFPEPHMHSGSSCAEATPSPSAYSVPDASSETTEPSQTGDSDSPLFLPNQSRPATPGNINSHLVDPEQADYFDMPQACIDMPSCLAVEGPEPSLPVDANDFGDDYENFMGAGLGRQDAQGLDQGRFASAAFAQPSPAADGPLPKSPQAIDIASRRNRRPAPLAITAGDCSYSSFALRTASDLDRRAGRASPIRRVASTGPSRVRKHVATPRSPFYDGKADLVFQTGRSPRMTGAVQSSPCPTGAVRTRAPPTPDTPVSLQHQMRVDGVVSYPLDTKYMAADLAALEDPTLRTPPTTPGFMDGLFSLGPSGYGMSVSEETLISPALDGLPGDFEIEMSTMTGGMPNQHASSLLPSQMGPAFFGGFLGDNTDYSWSEVSPSASSSPGLDLQPAAYLRMNMTS